MTEKTNIKTHWLQTPNKNYLGHFDLPEGNDVILTIAAAGWKEVKNPVINISAAKRVIQFVEKYSWVKPFICNEINAEAILKSTGEKYMESSIGKKIKLGVSKTKVKGEEVNCLRVRIVAQNLLNTDKVDANQVKEIQALLNETDKTAIDICGAYKVESLKDIPKVRAAQIIKRLKEISKKP